MAPSSGRSLCAHCRAAPLCETSGKCGLHCGCSTAKCRASRATEQVRLRPLVERMDALEMEAAGVLNRMAMLPVVYHSAETSMNITARRLSSEAKSVMQRARGLRRALSAEAP